MAFKEIIGHQHQIEALRQAIASERVPNAYLFVGPPNVGKTLIAREFARTVNCEALATSGDGDIDACGLCHNCVRIGESNHPDLMIVQPAVRVEVKPPEEDERGKGEPKARGVRREVYVDLPDALIYKEQIGELLRHLSAKPVLGRRKVAIICSAERMNMVAANHLLKTLEEPPPNTTFVLTSENPTRLLETIISRCQTMTFGTLPAEELLEALRTEFPEADESLRQGAAAISGGRYGRARWLLQAPDVLDLRKELLELASSTADVPLVASLAMGERLAEMPGRWWEAAEQAFAGTGAGSSEEREMRAEALEQLRKRSPDRINRIQVSELLDILQTWYRDLTLLRSNPQSELVINRDQAEVLRALAGGYTPEGLVWASQVIEETRRDLVAYNANFALACQVLMVKLISAARRR